MYTIVRNFISEKLHLTNNSIKRKAKNAPKLIISNFEDVPNEVQYKIPLGKFIKELTEFKVY